MDTTEPELFRSYPNLKEKLPWIHLLTNLPTPIDRLTNLEEYLELKRGEIYIKRDDKNHHIYGGNKLRKFEFIFGKALKKKKKGIITMGGIGTNHGLASAIVCSTLEPALKCHLFVFPQAITWHVQRSLLLFDYFGAKLHLGRNDITSFIKTLFFKLFHPGYYLMFPGGSPLLGLGTSLGTLGFINAGFELKSQIESGVIPEPDAIFIAGGSTGTAAGLIMGCKLVGLKTKVHIVNVYPSFVYSQSSVIKNSNRAIKFLHKLDRSIPKLIVTSDDFEFINGYLGSSYAVKTKRGQDAVDLVMELEGEKRGFKLETSYTGKTMAAMLDFIKKEENQSKKILFWNTYNSNDLDMYLKEINFNYNNLPKKYHRFYKKTFFQCWQIANCSEELREDCPAYLNHEYRFWRITECSRDKQDKNKAREILSKVIQLEDA